MGVNTGASEFFVAGGTLRPDSPSYVKRPADDELVHLVLAGQFCYVLTARQMGKSSLMIRAARRLGESGIRTAIIDLTKIGTDVSVEQWYLGLVTRLKGQLKLSINPEAWWSERASLGAVQRFTDFLHDVVLTAIEGPVVIFIDEIDTTLNLDFSDDFFAAVRACYNARASNPAYNRLSFVLLGVATPADLIKDRSRTPFNIGQGIDLREFSREDAQVLQEGLKAAFPAAGDAIFSRIFHWTNGHPYLTQKLCLTAAKRADGDWTDVHIDDLVKRLFLSEEARKETNLQFVRDSVRTSPRRQKLLTIYRQVYEGKEVREDERSLDQNRLKLYGLVRAEKGLLQIRNEIYRQAFNLDWIKANIPVDWTQRIAVISTLLVLLLAGVIGFSIYQQGQQTTAARAQAFVDSFRSTNSAEVRITSLAGLFDLPGYEDQARRLFYEELSPEEQLALFDLADPQAVGAQLIIVIKGLYTDLKLYEDLEKSEQDKALLHAVAQPLEPLSEMGDPMATNLAKEIEQWLKGRTYFAQSEYQQAVTAYSVAISLNERNPGTYFDRGVVYAALSEPSQTLADFETVLSLDEGWGERVRQVVIGDGRLYAALWSERETHRALIALVPTPTSAPTSTVTSTLFPTTSAPISVSMTALVPQTPTKPDLQPLIDSELIQITADSADEYMPSFSPDQQTLVVMSNLTGNWQIFVLEPDGSNWRRLTSDSSNYHHPRFSPDGRRIVFSADVSGDQEIYTMTADGSDWHQLTYTPGIDSYPSYSPNGKGILFMSERSGTWGVYRMNTDGGGQRAVIDTNANEAFPYISPDGQSVVFQSDDAGNWEIYIVSIDGGKLRQLTNNPARDANPVFSPDGHSIVFETNRDGDYEIYAMDSDGGNQRNLTNFSSGDDQVPSISPDGLWVVFQSDRNGSWDIFRIPLLE